MGREKEELMHPLVYELCVRMYATTGHRMFSWEETAPSIRWEYYNNALQAIEFILNDDRWKAYKTEMHHSP